MSVTFADLGVPAHLLAILRERGLEHPWPIQAQALPDALAGRDVCGRAPTGSGKTLAFAIPAVLAAEAARSHPTGSRGRGNGPYALILVPTRELASQVEEAMAPLARPAGVRTLAIYGGVGYGGQRSALRRGVGVVVGCPGRLEDLIAQGDLDLSSVRLVVIDEADRAADMGFLPAVKRLIEATRDDRQVLLFSATLDKDVDVLIRTYQHDPRRHEVAVDAADGERVSHLWWRAESEQRLALTADVLRKQQPAIVFCRTRHGADRLSQRLAKVGIGAAPIHGDRSQAQREKALAQFRAGRVQALVATDVAARGIHVDDVACVIHFDPPADPKDYVHRSGRTGRAGADGLVVSMVSRQQAKAVASMQRALGMSPALVAPDPAALGERRTAPRPAPAFTSGPSDAPAGRPRKPRPAAGGFERSGPRRNDARRDRDARQGDARNGDGRSFAPQGGRGSYGGRPRSGPAVQGRPAGQGRPAAQGRPAGSPAQGRPGEQGHAGSGARRSPGGRTRRV